MINVQTVLYGFRLIVVTKHQFAAAYITDALFLRRYMLDMIGSAAGQACTASGHSLYDVFIRYIYVDCVINMISKLRQLAVQNLSLRNGTRKTVQNITILAIVLCNTV